MRLASTPTWAVVKTVGVPTKGIMLGNRKSPSLPRHERLHTEYRQPKLERRVLVARRVLAAGTIGQALARFSFRLLPVDNGRCTAPACPPAPGRPIAPERSLPPSRARIEPEPIRRPQLQPVQELPAAMDATFCLYLPFSCHHSASRVSAPTWELATAAEKHRL